MSIIERCSSGNFEPVQIFFTRKKIRVMRLAIDYSFFVKKNGQNPDIDFCEYRFNEFIGKLNELYHKKKNYLLVFAYEMSVTRRSSKVFHEMIVTYPDGGITPEEWSDLWEWGYISHNVIFYERPCLRLERLRRKERERILRNE